MDDLHQCFQCSHQTAWLFQLDHHIQKKHSTIHADQLFHAVVEPEQFSCICCGYTSYCQLKLYEHYKQAHDPKNNKNRSFCEEFEKFLCRYCKYESDSRLLLAKHSCEKMPRNYKMQYLHRQIRARTNEQIYVFKCNQCSYRAKRQSSLTKHVMLRHVKTKLRDKNRRILQKYMRQNIWFQCSHCSHRSRQKGNLKRHMALRHSASSNESNVYHCNLCLYRVKFKNRLKMHMLSKHPTNKDEWFPCDHCPFQTKSKATLKEHALQHASDEPTSWLHCDHCSYRNKHQTNLRRHMLQHASNEDSDWLHSMLNMSKILRTHMRHEQTDWFQCNRCSYRANLKSQLIEHALTHETSSADADRYRAEQEAQWQVQVSKHEQLNRFPCNLCGYRAKQKAHLRSHMLQHEENKEIVWFQCEHCSYQAKRKASLKKHMAKHATNQNINWFQCERCSFGSQFETTVKMHKLECASSTSPS